MWRTTDNGGDRAFLDKYCNELTGDFAGTKLPCGDWQAARGPGRRPVRGRRRNYVVAVERATKPSSRTLWAATRKGDLYVSPNANAADPATVTFTQVRRRAGPAQPVRVEHRRSTRRNPNHAYLSYSGYSAYSPGGHVYDVTIDPATGTGTAKDISGSSTDGLGDQPVTDLVYSPSTSSLYASTDFGVLTRTLGSTKWVATRGLPTVAVYGLTLDERSHTLYAATHGRSVWKLALGR